jgi:hypothetical protein
LELLVAKNRFHIPAHRIFLYFGFSLMSFGFEDADFIEVFVCFDFEWRRILGQSCMRK